MLTQHEAEALFSDKFDLWAACERNGYHLPEYKSSINTWDFLKQVRHQQVYCPRYEEVKLAPCPEPPSSEILV